ncbi:Na/Pi cotransporter family protein [Dehalobacterium formicoaceticum]|uniref:Na/Pi cotransporter family protein n=1 Tax=Dehalobacterium formicoaceticum TaxID=51515 RepID=A0ABT1Y216_9FIRM|nr:Na/Pi cotransporter family protein [Dehalobacterium formicoaceticum]MCR6544598.1 Na/Pi cotransporter family protein [Dehalobacterium formicoaceticum]
MQELIFGLIGGTALLMYGVDKMGDGLEKASGPLMKKILAVLTGNVWSAFLVGTLLTALVQSSTAITVLTVGFVNAGLLKLPQAVGIIYGANIGTTLTAQLMAFSFKFKLTDIALPVVGIGFALSYFARRDVVKHLGNALMGFGLMFLGLKILNSGIPIMRESETLRYFFANYASIPIVGIFLGAAATAMVHSSSATVGLVMVLGMAGILDLKTAVLIMLGDNIGTCITAQLASMTGNIHARRTAWAHTIYNIFGVTVVALMLPWFLTIIHSFTQYMQPGANISAEIANSHTLFNIFSALVFLPLTKYYVKFLETVIRGRDEGTSVHLDKLLLDTPVAAIKATQSEIIRAAEITRKMVLNVMDSFYTGDTGKFAQLRRDEEKVNKLQHDITAYMVELSKRPMHESQSIMIPALINSINHLERVGDHAENFISLATSKNERHLQFSEKAVQELKEMETAIMEMYDKSIQAVNENDPTIVLEVYELEEKVDEIAALLVQKHIQRLEAGKCTVEAGVIFIDIVNYLERIADHVYKFCREISVEFKEPKKID